MLLGDIVKVEPSAIPGGDDAFGPQHRAVSAAVQSGEDALQLPSGEGAGSLYAPACEYLIGIVAMMVMLVAVMAALVFMLMMLVAVMAALVFMRMMFVVVMAAFMFVLVVVMAAADGACFRFFLRQKVCRQGIALLHRAQQLCAGELVPGVVTMGASGFFSRRRATAASSFSLSIFWVRLRMTAPAYWIWLV